MITDGPHALGLDLPDRDLDRSELERVATTIAGREELWRPLAEFGGSERHFESLHADWHVGIWVISWKPGNDTGFHDHDGSAGAVAVATGQIRIEIPRWGADALSIDASAGEVSSFGPSEIHRMVNVSGATAVTVHVYSPPLDRMGMYRVEDGHVRRRRVPWDEELKA
jgi:quercetin dioxygenase-like cupin family protein